ncbi:ATP-binding protein [Hymenobacter properus]|uniref:histidine kinase n=1 Tax=Hymenobacter properus TaxID=2791026 RepID=A0A931FJZ7_9BACT|nr:tetratricopeptide repeat protein [Hymenobacter properus]MBF9140506.1 tetratricopeptide repeat-containing sensor histidine kinase [Hymenobacter properus]MBR7719313.1 tetratricopeptide repeat-containing sensor histidine kinase [Microvirga sp. SRT04]
MLIAAGPALAAPSPPDTAQVRALLHQAQNLLRAGQHEAAQPLLQQAQGLAHRLHFAPGEIESLRVLGKAQLVHGSFAEARAYLAQGVALARRTPGQPHLADVLLTLGQVANEQDDYPGALRACEEALRLYHAQGALRDEARTRNGLGIIYSSRGDFPRALAMLLPALRLTQQLQDSALQANCLTNLGAVYFRHNQYREAQQYFRQALPLVRRGPDLGALADCLTNLAAAHQQLGELAPAETFYKEAIKVSEQAGERAQLGVVLSDYAQLQTEQKRLPAAQATLERARALLENSGDNGTLAATLVALGQLHQKLGHAAEAEAQARRALALAAPIQDWSVMETAGQLLASLLKQRGDYRQALTYAELAHAAHDTLFTQSKAEEMGRLQGDFQLSQERARAQALARTGEAQQQRLQAQQRQLWGLGLGLAVVAAAGLALWRLNRLLGHKNRQIELQRAELTELNATKDRLFSIIGHDLRGPLHSLHAFVELLDGPPLPPAKLSQYTQRLTRTLDNTLALLENLLNWAALQMRASAPIRPENLNLASLVEENIGLLSPAAEAADVTLTNRLMGEVHAWADPAAVRLVLRNLLSNAIKFTPAGGTVSVSATHENGLWQLAVADTGRGLPAPTTLQPLRPEALERRTGEAGQARSTGLGLLLSRDMATRTGGQLWVASAGPGQGTTFTLHLPAAEQPAAYARLEG